MSFLQTIAAFFVALGVLIAFHEFGHYLAARSCGVKVLRFCLGFGAPVISRRWGRDQTEWAIAAFPLGGYVKMLGQDPDEIVPEHERHRSFQAQTVGRRMWIVVAGPLANLLLAVGIYWGLNLHGLEEPVARIAEPVAESVAAQAQLRGGDTILSIDGSTVRAWGDLSWNLIQAVHDRRNIKLEIERGDRGNLVFVPLDLGNFRDANLDGGGDLIGKIGFRPFRPSPRIISVEAGSPAEKSGLYVGDILSRVDEQPIVGGDDFVRVMRANAGRDVAIEVRRADALVTLTVRPARIEKEGQVYGRIGAGIDDRPIRVRIPYGPAEALTKAVSHTWEMSIFSLKMLGRMVIGEVSWRNLSGPVTIADYAGKTARLGAIYYLNFIALVSISLGVLNLLPIPVLDGGYLLYYSIEAVRRRPVPRVWMETGAKFGLVVVVLAMSLALFNDISRLFAG